MAVIYDPRIKVHYLPNRNVGQSAFIDRMTAAAKQPIAQGTGINPSTLKPGDSILGGTFLWYNPTQGMRVRFNGKEITVPNNLDPRIYEHFKPDGTFDLVGSIASGANRWSDYDFLSKTAGLKIDGKTFQDAEKEAKAIRSGKVESLNRFVKDGKLDIVGAVNAGITNPNDFIGYNVSKDDIKEAQEKVKVQKAIEPYKLKEGGYDIVGAIRGGVSTDTLKSYFDISDSDLREYEIRATYTTSAKSGGAQLDAEKILTDLNNRTLSSKERSELANELTETFGLELVQKAGSWTFKTKTTVRSTDLPEGVTQSDIDSLWSQYQSTSDKYSTAFDAYREAGSQGVDDDALRTQRDNLKDEQASILSTIKYLESYENNNLDYKNPPTVDDIKIMLDVAKNGYDGSFVLEAVNKGISDNALMSLGYNDKGIDHIRTLNDLATQGYYNVSTGQIDAVSAVRGGISDDALLKIGYKENDITQIHKNADAINTLVKYNAFNDDTGAIDWQKAAIAFDELNNEKDTDKLAAAKFADLETAFDTMGISEKRLESGLASGRQFNDIEANNPELYKIYKEQGDEAFYTAYDEYIKSAEASKVEFEKNLEANSPEEFKIYKEQGYEAYEQALKALEANYALTDNWLKSNKLSNADGSIDFKEVAAYLVNQGIFRNDIDNETFEALKTTLGAMYGEKQLDYLMREYYTDQYAYETMVIDKKDGITKNLILVDKNAKASPDSPYYLSEAERNTYSIQQQEAKGISPELSVITAPYISQAKPDYEGAYNAIVKEKGHAYAANYFTAGLGMSSEQFNAIAESAKYNQLNPAQKLGKNIQTYAQAIPIAFKDNPSGFIGEIALSSIPIYGTMREFNRGEYGWGFVSMAADMLALRPAVAAVSEAVKRGATVADIAKMAAKNIIMAPVDIVRNPVKAVKLLADPLEIITDLKRLPIHSTWRGQYSAQMSMAKVTAGMTDEAAFATMQAMQEVVTRATAGESNIIVPIKGGLGYITYNPSELNKVFVNYAGHSTPFGLDIMGKGMTITDDGLFTSPEHILDFSFQSATGKSPMYIVNKKGDMVGTLAEGGKVLNGTGKNAQEIGQIANGVQIMGIDGKPLGTLLDGNKIVDKNGNVIAEITERGIVSSDPVVIGKYYEGQPYIANNKVLGTWQKNGTILDEAGKLVPPPKDLSRIVGYVDEGTNIVGVDGKTIIGATQQSPVFVMIATNGVQELPEAAKNAQSLKEFEKIMWEAVRDGEHGNKLYPVYKQYANWIEFEGNLPSGTNLIPVVDKKGNPFVMHTRDLTGRRIDIPVMQIVQDDWFEVARKITDVAAGEASKLKPGNPRKLFKEILGSDKAADEVMAWVKKNDGHLIGSGVEQIFSDGAIKAKDLDIAVANPPKQVEELLEIIKRNSKYEVRLGGSMEGNAVIERLKGGIWQKVIDLDPLEFATEELKIATKDPGVFITKTPEFKIVDGIKVMSPESQLYMIFDRMAKKGFADKGYARWERLSRFVGAQPDKIGIGAKPPTAAALIKLKIQGEYNMLKDIFVPGLIKYENIPEAAKLDKIGKTLKAGETTSDVSKTSKLTENIMKEITSTNDALTNAKSTKSLDAISNVADDITKATEKIAERTKLVEELAPDLVEPARKLFEEERRLAQARAAFKTAGQALHARAAGNLPRALQNASKGSIEKLAVELGIAEEGYMKAYTDLYSKLAPRIESFYEYSRGIPSKVDARARANIERDIARAYSNRAMRAGAERVRADRVRESDRAYTEEG